MILRSKIGSGCCAVALDARHFARNGSGTSIIVDEKKADLYDWPIEDWPFVASPAKARADC